jgi:O-antigen ligase
VTAFISLLIVSATAAFGAVYSWGYVPLFVAAACSGLVGLVRHRGVPLETRGIAIGLVCVALAVGAQLIPLSRSTLDLVSPRAVDLLDCYSLTFAASGRHPLSINPAATTRGLLGLTALGLYLVGVPSLFSSRDLRALTRNLMLFAVPLALAGIFGREHNNGLVYGFWQPQEGSNGNGFGPFVNRNHFAGWMLMTSSLAIGALCGQVEIALEHVKPGLRNRVVWLSSRDASGIILTAVSIVVMAVSLVWTMSRSGIVSFTCAVACFAWLMARRRKVGSARRIGVIATLGALLLVSISWRGVDRLVQWFSDTTDLEGRLAAWRDGWQVMREFPLAGTGINTYPDVMLFYQRHVLDVWMTHAHNDYLQFLAEGGLLVSVPAALALALLVIAIGRSVNGARNAGSDYWIRTGASVGLVAIGIQETVEFSLQMPANALLFATLAAVAISPTHKSSRRLRN